MQQSLSLQSNLPSASSAFPLIMTHSTTNENHHNLRLRGRALFMDDGDSSSLTGSTITVVWFCVVAFVTVAIVIFCACLRRRRNTRNNNNINQDNDANDTTQEESELARMEANVKVFAEKQQSVQRKHLIQAMKGQFVKVTPHDLEHRIHISDGCAICRETFLVGDCVAHNTVGCRHMFHQECILSWFVSAGSAEYLCPCCRQCFLVSSPPAVEQQRQDAGDAPSGNNTTVILMDNEDEPASSSTDGTTSTDPDLESARRVEEQDLDAGNKDSDDDEEDSPVIDA